MSETYTEAVLTVLHPPWGIPFSPVFGSYNQLSTLLCVLPAGLQPPSATLLSIRLLSWLHCAFLAASSLTDCFRPASCTSAIIGVYALRNSLPLVVWLRYRFIQAAIALSLALSFVALLLMLVVGFRCVFCLISAFLFHVRSPSIVVASACHHSVRLHSPALRPVFMQLARTACLCL